MPLVDFLRRLFLPNNPGYRTTTGTTADLESLVQRVMRSTPEAFVIVEVNPEGDFVQFQGDSKGIRLDFPQATERQRAFKDPVLAAFRWLDLDLIENESSDGSISFECDIDGDSGSISVTLTKFLGHVFQVSDSSQLKFTSYGLAP